MSAANSNLEFTVERIRKEMTYARMWSEKTHHPEDHAKMAFLLKEADTLRAEVSRLTGRVEELERAGRDLLESVDAREEKPDCWCTDPGVEPGVMTTCGACLMRAALSPAEPAKPAPAEDCRACGATPAYCWRTQDMRDLNCCNQCDHRAAEPKGGAR